MQATTPAQSIKTIPDVKLLTFADWQAIAAACCNTNTWAFIRWVETSSQLDELTRDDIDTVAKATGQTASWVTNELAAFLSWR